MLDDSHKRKSLGRGLGALLGGDMDFMTSELSLIHISEPTRPY